MGICAVEAPCDQYLPVVQQSSTVVHHRRCHTANCRKGSTCDVVKFWTCYFSGSAVESTRNQDLIVVHQSCRVGGSRGGQATAKGECSSRGVVQFGSQRIRGVSRLRATHDQNLAVIQSRGGV